MSAAAAEDDVEFPQFNSLPLPSSSVMPQPGDVVDLVAMMLQDWAKTSTTADDGIVVHPSITDSQSESYNTGAAAAAPAAQVDMHQCANISDELDCSFTETDLYTDFIDLSWFSDY